MAMFTIDGDNNITAYPTPEAAQNALTLGSEAFTTNKELGKLAADWPASRLTEIWNGFAGTAGFDDLRPVKKFTSRKVAVGRIWEAIQRMAAAADGGGQCAPEVATPSKEATRKKSAPKAKKGTKGAKAKPEGREGTKKSRVIEMMKRDNGATNAEIQQATDWQPHTIRGFVSGSLVKKMRLKVETITRQDGLKAYYMA